MKINDGIKSLGEIKGSNKLNASLLDISENIKNLGKVEKPQQEPENGFSDVVKAIVNSPYYIVGNKKKYKLIATYSTKDKDEDEIHSYKYYEIEIEYGEVGNDGKCSELEDSKEKSNQRCKIIGVGMTEDIKYSDFYINGTPDTIIKSPTEGTAKTTFKAAFTSKGTHKLQVGLHGYGDIRPLSYEYNCVDDISHYIIEYFFDWLGRHLIMGIALIAQLITNIALIYTTILKVISKNNRKKRDN